MTGTEERGEIRVDVLIVTAVDEEYEAVLDTAPSDAWRKHTAASAPAGGARSRWET